MENLKFDTDWFVGKKGLVLGLARSGQAAARLIAKAGAEPVLYDKKPYNELKIEDYLLNINESSFISDSQLDIALNNVDFAVLSPGLPLDNQAVAKTREKGIKIFGELDFAYLFAKCPLYAISGTNGKTTTVSLLGEMLKKKYKNVAVAGNIGYPLSSAALEVDENGAIAVEVSSFQLESAIEFSPKVACLLNISPDHLDRHKTIEEYVKLKKRLLELAQEYVIINADDPIISKFNVDKKRFEFSLEREVENGAYLADDSIIISIDGHKTKVIDTGELLILGKHNIQNALSSVIAAYLAGVRLQDITEVLKSFKAVEHRIEYVDTVDGIEYINDSKGTNPDSTIKAVEAMKKPTVLILGGYDKKISFDDLARTIVDKKLIKNIVLIGDCISAITSALDKLNYKSYYVVGNDFKAAMKKARHLASNGDTVLLSPACASFGMFNNYEERGKIFKEIVFEFKTENG